MLLQTGRERKRARKWENEQKGWGKQTDSQGGEEKATQASGQVSDEAAEGGAVNKRGDSVLRVRRDL